MNIFLKILKYSQIFRFTLKINRYVYIFMSINIVVIILNLFSILTYYITIKSICVGLL